jgi:hypothetical protein
MADVERKKTGRPSQGGADKDKGGRPSLGKRRRTTVRWDEEIRDQVNQYAESRGLPVNSLVNLLMRREMGLPPGPYEALLTRRLF